MLDRVPFRDRNRPLAPSEPGRQPRSSQRVAVSCISPSPDAPNRASSTVFPTMAKRCEALTWCDANTASPSVSKTVDEPRSRALHDLRLHQIGPRRPFVGTQPRGSVPDETHPRSVIRCGADPPRAPNPALWTRIATRRNRFPVRSTFFILEQTPGKVPGTVPGTVAKRGPSPGPVTL